jgi:hypothetical protein
MGTGCSSDSLALQLVSALLLAAKLGVTLYDSFPRRKRP